MTQSAAQQGAPARAPHKDDDEDTEAIAYGVWLLQSPLASSDAGQRRLTWDVLREETGAPTWMAKARFVQASARAFKADAPL